MPASRLSSTIHAQVCVPPALTRAASRAYRVRFQASRRERRLWRVAFPTANSFREQLKQCPAIFGIMCILVASRNHPDYALVVLDNRDEYMDRATAPAHWWPDTDIYGPQDLARSEKGTWIGITHSGRIAVLLNFHEQKDYRAMSPVSRGILPKLFLESQLSPKEWKRAFENHNDYAECGGFTLMVGVIDPAANSTKIEFVSNRKTNFGALGSHKSVAVSNGAIDDPTWAKTGAALNLLAPLLKEHNREKFKEDAIRLLSTTSQPLTTDTPQLRNHIFVPRIELRNSAYGTRTQTVLTVDHSGNVEVTSVDTVSQQKFRETFCIIPKKV